jgi:hypothetical protein
VIGCDNFVALNPSSSNVQKVSKNRHYDSSLREVSGNQLNGIHTSIV